MKTAHVCGFEGENDMTKREDILRKLKVLAECGVGGEAVNAGELLKRMLEIEGRQ